MKKFISFCLFLVAVNTIASAQCDTNKIDTLKGVPHWDLGQTEDSAKFAFDNDPNTIYDGNTFSFNFTNETHLNGALLVFDIKGENKFDKVVISGSSNGSDWVPLLQSGLSFQKKLDSAYFYFGTTDVNYVKVSLSGANSTGIKDAYFFEDSCPNGGLKNPVIDFPTIANAYTQINSITLSATETENNLPVSFKVIEGGATISGNQLSTNGYSGAVTVEASVSGQTGYYNASTLQTFILLDESDYKPAHYLSVTEDYPLELRAWEGYPIYSRASMQDPLSAFTLESNLLYIDGEQVNMERTKTDNGQEYYQYLWHPKEYKTYEVKLVSTASNKESTTTIENMEVVKGATGQQVTTLDGVVIWFGKENSRNYQGSYTLPQHVGVYDKITAHLDVECPNNNCDDWDRWAYIDVMGPDGNWIQIIRYITPYGVGCDHSIDLTPYASLLQGNVPMRVFIDTWGTGGWKLTLDLDFQAGTPQYLYSQVDEIWDGTYDFGNPAKLQPVDTVNYKVADGVDKAELIISTTGHGWGENNTSNAAEFFNAFHDIEFNGTSVYQQNLWNNCNPNPDGCTGQLGTWTFNRAGWCPGAISPPDIYEASGVVSGDSFQLTYKFHETYVDKCHPNSPDCKSGTTCPDCNAGYNPHYQIDGQIVNYSNEPILYDGKLYNHIDPLFNETLGFNVYPNPSETSFQVTEVHLEGPFKLIIKTVDGKAQAVYYFSSSNELKGKSFSVDHLDAGLYFVQIQGTETSGFKELIVR